MFVEGTAVLVFLGGSELELAVGPFFAAASSCWRASSANVSLTSSTDGHSSSGSEEYPFGFVVDLSFA